MPRRQPDFPPRGRGEHRLGGARELIGNPGSCAAGPAPPTGMTQGNVGGIDLLMFGNASTAKAGPRALSPWRNEADRP